MDDCGDSRVGSGCARLVSGHPTCKHRARALLRRLRALANATWSFEPPHWRFVVVAMLALLHVAVLRGIADPWARALLLAHLGLLLLWQPFLRGEQRGQRRAGTGHRPGARSR